MAIKENQILTDSVWMKTLDREVASGVPVGKFCYFENNSLMVAATVNLSLFSKQLNKTKFNKLLQEQTI